MERCLRPVHSVAGRFFDNDRHSARLLASRKREPCRTEKGVRPPPAAILCQRRAAGEAPALLWECKLTYMSLIGATGARYSVAAGAG